MYAWCIAMKTIALVAHDSRKMEMAEWANYNREWLKKFHLVGTESTAENVKNISGLEVESLGHGPEGGDIYLSYQVLSGQVQALIFFIDVENPHGHEHDIQTLIRIAVLKNIPLALNRATADYLISSVLLKPG